MNTDYIMMRLKNGTKIWQMGEYGPKYPTMSIASLGKVLKAIITIDGKILDTCTLDCMYNRASVLYLVEIPVGSEKDLESMTGYTLSEPLKVNMGG